MGIGCPRAPTHTVVTGSTQGPARSGAHRGACRAKSSAIEGAPKGQATEDRQGPQRRRRTMGQIMLETELVESRIKVAGLGTELNDRGR